MPATLPNFLIIGAQKCGTSWLHKHLSAHPDVFLPANKELEFFSYAPHLQSPGFGAYLENFQEAGPARAIGEATASYFWSYSASPCCVMPEGFQTNIPAVVKQHLGAELRLIVLLRHPVRRAISAYLHYLNEGELEPAAGFEQSMKFLGVVDMGFYARHLAAWLEEYDLSQIKILTLENDIQAQPEFTLSGVCEFLGIDNHPFRITDLEKVVYAGIPTRISQEGVFADLREVMSRHGHERAQSSDEYTQVLDRGQWHELESIYQADVARLDSLLGTHLLDDWGLLG